MRTRTLGSTGLHISEVGFGGIPIIQLQTEAAVTVLRRAVDRGITFFDTAHVYVDSEEKMGRAFAGIRDRLVIASKTIQRKAKEAMADLELSLTRLGTDHLDLYQPHQVSQPEELDALLGPDGAMEALFRARDQGKIRHLGITSHNLAMARKLVATGLFATIQFPYNLVETEAAVDLFPEAKAAGMGHPGHETLCRRHDRRRRPGLALCAPHAGSAGLAGLRHHPAGGSGRGSFREGTRLDRG